MRAFYNDVDSNCCDILSNAMDAGLITPGVIDDRSVDELRPADFDGFDRVHLFAGVGTWDYAITASGVTGRILTASCPCQPFSQAGAQLGFDDERHLWPDTLWLITVAGFPVVLGEQVASSAAEPWLDLVQSDLEGHGYTFGAIPFPSAGVGAPHIRDRLYWLAYAGSTERKRRGKRPAGDSGAARSAGNPAGQQRLRNDAGAGGNLSDGLADTRGERREGERLLVRPWEPGESLPEVGRRGEAIGLANTDHAGLEGRHVDARGCADQCAAGSDGVADRESAAGPVNGFWSDADWLFCRDEKWRPVEPGTQPLAHGLPASMGRCDPRLRELAEVAGLDKRSLADAKSYRTTGLRAFGNAINPVAAIAFITSAKAASNNFGTGV